MNAVTQSLRMLALQAPLARLSRMLGKADEATVSRRHTGRLPEVRPPVLDGDRLLIDAEELNAWVLAKADEYHGKGDDPLMRMMNAGRVDGYWNVAALLQQFLRDASAMSASGQDQKGLEAKPASAVANGETPKDRP